MEIRHRLAPPALRWDLRRPAKRAERQIREEESLRTAGEIAKRPAGEADPNKALSVERLRQIPRDVYGVRVEEEKPEARKGLSAETAVEIRRQILGIPDRQSPATAN